MSFSLTKRLTIADYAIYAFITLVSVLCVFPFIYVVSVSFTDPAVYVPMKFTLWPAKWSLTTYAHILSTQNFQNALQSTVFITAVGTTLNIITTFTFAYGLSKRDLPGNRFFATLVLVTLLFSAGIVPTYKLMQTLKLINSQWALILGGLTNAWSLIVVRSFIDALPSELDEAARIDGCTYIGVFLRIIVPLSLPSIATFTLFFAVGHWNSYFAAVMYLTDPKKWTLQVLIKMLVIDADSTGVIQAGADDKFLPQETVRMASVVLAILPILVLYPFLQRYFVKGVMLGAVKG